MTNIKCMCFIILLVSGISVCWICKGNYACEPDTLEVMFKPDYYIRIQNGVLMDLRGTAFQPREFSDRFGPLKWKRLCGQLTEERVDQMHQTAEMNLQKPILNMNNMYYLTISKGKDIWEAAEILNSMPEILRAAPIPLPQPLPTPNHEPEQEYLNNAPDWPPTGLSAYYAWTENGGSGELTTICDLEYSWNYNHVDLTKARTAQMNPLEQDPYSDTHHGTAVIGELIADDNGWGVTGICHDAYLKTYGTYWDDNPPYSNPQWKLPEAMMNAGATLFAGDVMLLEQQWEYTPGSKNYIPIEWWTCNDPNPQGMNGVYYAIQTLIGNGIHVVEAGGNGGVNLDTLTWYGDSGAIVVGAGGAYDGGFYPQGDLVPLDYSCYGLRVNLHAWGENVSTTGYGSYTGYTSLDDMYCWDFCGTSSASPMVAACVVCCNGYWTRTLAETASSLSPALMRSILVNTGTPQDTFTTRTIGPRPNLEAAFHALDLTAPARFYEVDLVMPAHSFSAGSLFNLWAYLSNPSHHEYQVPFAVILDVAGHFWFYPTWSNTFTYDTIDLYNGVTSIEIIPDFSWPAGTGSVSGIRFYGALLTHDLSSIWGLYDMEEFSYSS